MHAVKRGSASLRLVLRPARWIAVEHRQHLEDRGNQRCDSSHERERTGVKILLREKEENCNAQHRDQNRHFQSLPQTAVLSLLVLFDHKRNSIGRLNKLPEGHIEQMNIVLSYNQFASQ